MVVNIAYEDGETITVTLDAPTIRRVESGDQVVLNAIRTTYAEAQHASDAKEKVEKAIRITSSRSIHIINC